MKKQTERRKRDRNLERNKDSIEEITNKFNPAVIFPNYSQKLKEIASK